MAETPDGLIASTAPPSHPADRHTTIAVALIAVMGVVFGGLVAAGSSWMTAARTSESRKEQALDEYRRDTRREAYTRTLRDFDNLSAWERDISTEVSSRKSSGHRFSRQEYDAKILRRRARNDDLFGALKNNCTTNEIIASQRVADVCEAMLWYNASFIETFDYSLKEISDVERGSPPPVSSESPFNTNSDDNKHDLDNADNVQLRENMS